MLYKSKPHKLKKAMLSILLLLIQENINFTLKKYEVKIMEIFFTLK